MAKKKVTTGWEDGLKVKNGIYQYKFMWEGVLKQGSCRTGNKREAITYRDYIKGQLRMMGIDVKLNNSLTFKMVWNKFLEVEEPRLSRKNIYNTKLNYNKYWKSFENIKIRDLQPEIDSLFRKVSTQLAPTTQKLMFKQLKSVILLSKDRGFHNVFLEFPKIKISRAPKQTLSMEEMVSFFQLVDQFALSTHEKAILQACYYLGMRISEALRLSWEDYNEKTQMYLFDEKQKNRRPVEVPVPDSLQRLFATLERIPGQPLMCPGRFGGEHSTDYLDIILPKISVAMGFKEKITAHRLRASFCKNMLREGVPIEKVSKLCRHKNIQTTLEYYAEIEMEDLRDSINVLDPMPKTPEKDPEPGNIIKFKVG